MKFKNTRKLMAFILAFALIFSSMVPAFADSSDTYVALGADLTSEQKATVLGIMGLTEDDMEKVDTVTVTNAQEYQYLGSYLPKSVIGTKSLSCVRVDKKKSGGITVTTHNISYCTEGMYQNALITAGIENADVVVAAPFSISGTAGLVGAMIAYEQATGETIDADNSDAAVEEIVTTGDLADQIGDSDKAENFVALCKQKAISMDGATDEEILKMIDETASEIGISLTDAEKQQLLSLMKKIAALDLDPDTLKKQATDIYNRLQDLGVDMSGIDKETVTNAFTKLINGIIDFFKGLFS